MGSSLREIGDKSELGRGGGEEVHGVGGGARSIWSKDRRSRSIRAPLSADKSPFRGAIVEGIT